MQTIANWLVRSDRSIFTIINKQLQCNVLDVIMPRITHLGGATFTISSLLILLIFTFGEQRFWTIEAIASLTISHIFVHFIKKLYGRKRPYMIMSDARIFDNPLVDYSFPSGHTTASFAISIVFALHSFILGVILVPLAAVIGISRMYLGLHYPTDVFVGASLGSLTAILVVQYFA